MDNRSYDEKVDDELNFNTSFEVCRKTMVRAGMERRHLLEVANRKTYVLTRFHEDNLVHRGISTALMLSDDKEKLKEFCRNEYGAEFMFDENDRTQNIMTPIGKANFQILEIGII